VVDETRQPSQCREIDGKGFDFQEMDRPSCPLTKKRKARTERA
jgi:hypothetical protein